MDGVGFPVEGLCTMYHTLARRKRTFRVCQFPLPQRPSPTEETNITFTNFQVPTTQCLFNFLYKLCLHFIQSTVLPRLAN
jgi:hypothetical protein